MGRLDTNIKCMEIQNLAEEKKYKEAEKVLDTLNIVKIKFIRDLKTFAEVYQMVGRYEDATDVLLQIYNRTPNKRVVYRLAYLAILKGDYEEAEDFFQEYIELASDDWEQYILQYGMQKAKGEGYDSRIKTLQQLKEMEYMEEWGYELAKLYHKAGRGEECVEECNDLILWFGEGVIVEKAKLLRTYHLEGKESLDAYGVFDNRKDGASNGQASDMRQQQAREVIRKELDRDLTKTMNLQQVMRQELESDEMKHLRNQLEDIWGDQEVEEVSSKPKQAFINQETMPIAEEMEELPVIQIPSGLKTEAADVVNKNERRRPISAKRKMEKTEKEEKVTFNKEEWLMKVKEINQREKEDGEHYERAIQEQVTKAIKPIDTSIKVGGYDFSNIFSDYLENTGLREQIKTELNRIKPGEEAVNFIISGQTQGGMELARALGKVLKELDVIQSDRIARISAEKLNKLQLSKKQSELKHSCMVVEQAGEITADTAQSIINMMSQFDKDIVVILIDRNEAIADLFEKYQVLGRYFKFNIAL